MRTDKPCSTRIRPRPFTAAALLLLVAVAGSAAQPTATPQAHDDTHAKKPGHWFQIGKASWYGRRFQGHRTASGEAFDLNLLTCAHRTLPIGTLLRVTNLVNRKTILVRVNDRGPVQKGLIVDLSFAAARSLGVAGQGMLRVSLEKVSAEEAAQLNWPDLGQPPSSTGELSQILTPAR